MRLSTLALLCSASAWLVTASVAQTNPPATPIRPVVDTYFNVHVTDNYRWLEDWSNPQVKQWVAEQDAYTAATMDKLPQRDPILNELKSALREQQTRYSDFKVSNGRLFALRYDPGAAAGKLVVFASPRDKSSERRIVDLANFIPGKIFQVAYYQVSPNSKLVGLALATGGSEDASLYIVSTATGKQVGTVVPRANFATGGGAMAWLPDSSGFYYTRYPQGHERPAADMNFYQQVYLHTLGKPSAPTPGQDRYILGKDFPRVAETSLVPSPDGSQLLITVADGDGGFYETFLLGRDGVPHQITRFSDKIPYVTFGQDNSLWFLSHKNSLMGEIFHLRAGDETLADATLVVPASDSSIEGSGYDPSRLFVAADRLYLTVIRGGPEKIRAYTLAGKRLPNVPTPAVASVGALVPDGSGAFLFSAETDTTPEQWYRYSGAGTAESLPFAERSAVSLADIEVQRVFATSKDGTRIPMTILLRKGTVLNGSNPTLLTGYGGFGISESPRFRGQDSLWFRHGGIFAIANLRGGAENGEAWHQGGMLTQKQNVFDDFAACADYLVDHHYTSPAHLAAEGGSNGGLLMGVMVTQHPQLFRAIVSYVGIYDMLRNELDPNGAFNITEYGTVKNPADFRAISAYSPYQHVAAHTPYPAVLFITGDNDHRVNPANSRKMTAELQAATSSGNPILLLTNAHAGHGVSTNVSEALVEQADAWAFLFANLGISMN
ncbi:MAG TPA: prolyl oligopeptidase family serine peptidase [Terracidiphilus sp.]|nr:prolyl oligopeptidase family serine peptidase [Terracidiphilus sp.]